MNVSEQLNKAADLIEERGWIAGEGWLGGGKLCLEGAIAAVLGIAPEHDWEVTEVVNFCPAGEAVRDYLNLGGGRGIGALWYWNDHHAERSGKRVVEVLRAAALIEQARESERETAQVPA